MALVQSYHTIDRSDALLNYLLSTDEKAWQKIESNPVLPKRIEDLLT